MWKGFRQNHPRKEDQRFCVITFVHPITGKRVYSRLNGLPFGMGTVVNQFNRLPHLKTAVLRRLLGILACHYFDDELVMDFGHMAAQTQALSHRLSEMWGIKYSPKKRQVVSIHTTFLGNSYDWADWIAHLAATFGVKPATRAKAVGMVLNHLYEFSLSPGASSKLRGLLQWADRGMTGRPCRGALTALTERQYFEDKPGHTLSPQLHEALNFLLQALQIMPDRKIQLGSEDKNPQVLYSDASTTGGGDGLRIGILLLEKGKPGRCAVHDVPGWVIRKWKFRSTYIGQGELLAGPLALTLFGEQMTSRDITWYVDNQAALSALAKTCSVTADNSPMALVSGLMAALMQAIIWYEWVPTHQNASDGLSRDGWIDRNVRQNIASGEWVSVKQEPDWNTIAGGDLRQALEILQRWES